MMRVSASKVVAVVLLAVLLPASSSAQTEARESQTPPPSSSAQAQGQQPRQSDASADLSITARVTARELRFEKVPNPKVEFTGRPRRETVWESERENLPEQVQPGVTYRDIGITLRITSVFADIERIVAEALGEIPVSDDAPQPEGTPQGSQSPAPAPQSAPPADARPDAVSNSSPPKAPAAALRSKQRNRPPRKGRGR